jgi:hypothetical protein
MQNVDNEKLETLITEIEAFVTQKHTNQELKNIVRQRPAFFRSVINEIKRVEDGQIHRKPFVDLALSSAHTHNNVWLFSATPTKIKEFLSNDCGLPKSEIMKIICCYI